MPKQRRHRAYLLGGLLTLFAGATSIWDSRASWGGGTVQIFGGQAIGFGLVCILFSIGFFVMYFRGTEWKG